MYNRRDFTLIGLLIFIGSGFVEAPPPEPEPATAPANPDAPVASNITDSGATISWSDPDDGGSPITATDLQWRVQGANPWQNVSSPVSPVSLSNLAPETTYSARFRVWNSVGRSDWSPIADFTTSA